MSNTIAKMISWGTSGLRVGLVAFCAVASAADTDIAAEPMITSSSSSVKPNLFFILDNSGSMNWDYLPDAVIGTAAGTDTAFLNCKGAGVGTGAYCCRNELGQSIVGGGFGTNTYCLPQSSYRGMPPFHSSSFNSVYYNPEIYYQVPQDDAGNPKTSYDGLGSVPWDGYGVQSSSSLTLTSGFPDVEWCTDLTYGDCVRADNYVLPGIVAGKSYDTMHPVSASGTAVFAQGTVDAPSVSASRSVGPYYYVMIPAEYCDSNKQTSCSAIDKALSSEELARVARVRWCSDAQLTNCKLTRSGSYTYPRYPTIVRAIGSASSPTATMTAGGVGDSNCSGSGTGACGSGAAGTVCVGRTNVVTVSSIVANGTTQILTAPFVYCNSNNTGSNRNNGLATAVAARIAASGFTATSSSANITIVAPVGNTYNGKSVTGVVTGATLSAGTFNNGGSGTVASVPGSFKRIDIVAGQTYGDVVDGHGNKIVDRSSRTDCAARPNCTYAEELKNFANWFAWYRTRMQMMKSAVGLSFQSVDDHFRVGFFTINSSSSNLVNMADFGTGQKTTWYSKLYGANPNGGTPLREALANAGRVYAGKTAITDVTDPVQYSCQRNYTILSTDGYWNGNNGYYIDGTTSISNEDGTSSGLSRPELDGLNNSSTLADVAAYYYNTDLRTGCVGGDDAGKCKNDVKTTARDSKQTQHMVTYTLGLGQNGVMQYRKNYLSNPKTSDNPDDYSAIKAGTLASNAETCSWQNANNNACNWPTPGANRQENIDDMWHAAVNSHAIYFRADTWRDVSDGLREIMRLLEAELGAAAAATTSNPNVTAEDNLIFSSSYRSGDWSGDLVLQQFNIADSTVSGNVWGSGAGPKITAQGTASRNIWTFDAGGTAGDRRKAFNWANLNAGTAGTCSPPASEQGCFTSPYIDTMGQFCSTCLSATQKADASGTNLVDYLRGNQAHEQTASVVSDRWYRTRAWDATANVLGDIVSSEAVYVGKYLYNYGSGYPTGTNRSYPSVYVAANDGMLHAIDATASSAGGSERWAYVPSMVLRNMYKLADIDYGAMHRYFVDGTPVVADVLSGTWKTILVGGLAGGGPGYYALEIDSSGGGTNQTQPKVLWEFRYGNLETAGTNKGQINNCTTSTAPRYNSVDGVTADCDLGFSFGNPVIGKVGGTWVVMVTSGYNNNSGGDGKGYLYVLDAMTGQILKKIATGAGDTTDPSGLGRIVGWVDDAMKDNTITTVYGGDLLGNMWAFDPVAGSSRLLINASGKPITAKPEIGEVTTSGGVKKKVVFFPTGRLLGTSDVSAPLNGNYFYGVWDDGSTASVSELSTVARAELSSSGGKLGRGAGEITSTFENTTSRGWRLEFQAGEQGNTDPTLAFGTLVFSTNIPTGSADACSGSGFGSWIYNIDWLSGGPVDSSSATNTYMATYYTEAATRPNVVVVDGIVKSITRLSDATNKIDDVLIKAQSGQVRRVSWRELVE